MTRAPFIFERGFVRPVGKMRVIIEEAGDVAYSFKIEGYSVGVWQSSSLRTKTIIVSQSFETQSTFWRNG